MKRIISFVLAIFMLAAYGVCAVYADEFEDPDVDLGVGFGKFFENYGYEYLYTLPNGEDLQSLYDVIDTKAILFDLGYTTSLSEGNVLTTIDFTKYDLVRADAEIVWEVYKNDHPLYYWLSPEAGFTDSKISIAVEEEFVSTSTRKQYNKEIDAALERIITSAAREMSAYRIVLAYRDALTEDADLAYAADGVTPSADRASNTILGAFVTGSGTSVAYAKALQLLLDYSEIESVFVTGKRDGIPHAWNLVKLDDGKWYWVDLTVSEEDPESDAFCLCEGEFAALPYEYRNNLPTGVGEEFLYELPARAEAPYDGGELILGDAFTVDGFTYEVAGYNKVRLVGMTGMSGSVSIPESVTYGEKDHAVTSISGALAAVDCGGMSSLTIPASVGYVGAGFAAELPIESISVAEDSEYYVSIDGVLYSSSADCIIKYPNAKSGAEYVIPASVREIAGGAFVGCTQLGKVVFEGDAPEVRPAGSDKPSFDAEAVTLYCDPARSGWLDSEDYDADARTWMGYKLRRIGDSGVSVSGEVSFYDGSSAATVTLVQDGEAAYEITLAPSDEVGQNVRAFEITDVEDGVYDLVITAEGHLSFTVTGINVSGENVDLTQSGKAELSTITLVAGDVNRDGCVDLKDVTLLTSFNTYGRTYSDAETKSADINGDKCFDLKDLTIITSEKNYGKSPVKIEY